MKPVHSELMNWEGKRYKNELFAASEFNDLGTATQVQAVCFADDEHIVLLEHVDGYKSLPGGTIESGESFEEALKRELQEEVSVDTLDFGMIGYSESTQLDNNNLVTYQLRYWADVALRDEVVNDPDGKAKDRVVVPLDHVAEVLGWGDKGEALIKLAKEARVRKHEK